MIVHKRFAAETYAGGPNPAFGKQDGPFDPGRLACANVPRNRAVRKIADFRSVAVQRGKGNIASIVIDEVAALVFG